jgi:DNA-binding protein H-NS
MVLALPGDFPDFILARRMQLKKSSFASLSNEALCKLRDEIAALLKTRAENLRKELELLTGGEIPEDNGGTLAATPPRKKIAPKYRGPDGCTWTGRGMMPRWLASALKEGKKLEDFLIVAPEEGSRDH